MSGSEPDAGNNRPEMFSGCSRETASKWTVMGIVGLGVFMATLDSSIVNISLPKISLSFHAPLNGLVEWVIIAYLIVIACLLLILGRISDMVGQRLMWVLGLAIFTLSSILCGLAPSLLSLVIFRGCQGVGGAQAGAGLSQRGASPTGLLEAVFTHAFQVALLTCMVVASLGVFTSLMRGQAL